MYTFEARCSRAGNELTLASNSMMNILTSASTLYIKTSQFLKQVYLDNSVLNFLHNQIIFNCNK